MTPPPGWYRDPTAPHQERWWDGTAWTEHRRVPEAPTQPLAGGRGGGRGRAVALVTAAAVLVAAIVTGVFFLREDDGGDPGARTLPTTAPSPPADPAPPTTVPGSSPAAREDPDAVQDELNGISFRLPKGWERPRYVAEHDVMMTTAGSYDCPADGSVCHHGLVISRTVTANAESAPRALAEQDIQDAADDAYDRDLVGNKPFGGVTSHRVVGAGPVAVAGRAGYFVRWQVSTAKGPGGYVQSMAFPASVGTESPVLVRYVFDAGEDGPPLADMDRITKSIRAAGSTGGGVGSSVGP
ncbi:DUF2510 domain-containing protein [Streptomyces sp. NPDC003717]|uniref:DUF2510 domain-containing protein n=1 Tax=Streptomyces sp. NPDC003717 TaxID=3154276 RepID=UPI0033BA500F